MVVRRRGSFITGCPFMVSISQDVTQGQGQGGESLPREQGHLIDFLLEKSTILV